MTHPNDMSVWQEITCQRGHDQHSLRFHNVRLANHRFKDLPQVPGRLQQEFFMYLWDPAWYPVDGGPYCPAHDAVSETIVTHGIWEPQETILTLHTAATASSNQIMVDIGSQLGWFSLLSASSGLPVRAYEADSENVRALRQSVAANAWVPEVRVHHTRFGVDIPELPNNPIRLAKIDIEGAEDKAVAWLMPAIEDGDVDHLLMEVSPVFSQSYGPLVALLMDSGMDAYRLPEKQIPPVPLNDPPGALVPFQLRRKGIEEQVNSWHQESVWFKRNGLYW